MVSQEELEYAIARFKARQSGEAFDEPAPRAQSTYIARAEEVEADAYQVEDSVGEADVYAQEALAEGYGGEGVPQYVSSLSDSSLIELGEESLDPDPERG